ncbi:protein-lysine N-methyltransferase EEF2KMT isoform X1 [Trachypithecus francoisi]|uniref:protein-lysine N-methyltransferase EEF2KMT isoform X1 n=1 Tax=Trachypithecus francoisi TaxID=54180 RepID=UPI00141B43AF|nr:protein-lysine N-methyltransferase EEF2KMT isoform X1 [Trachypithecus francoisi]
MEETEKGGGGLSSPWGPAIHSTGAWQAATSLLPAEGLHAPGPICNSCVSLEAKLRDSSDSELLRDILQKTVKHPVCVKHPPSVKYVQCFLSELIKKHEAVHTEPLDELYEAMAETLMAKESTQGHRSYLLPSGGSVTLSESTAIISHGTTGLVTWDAALYLAEWAIENPAAFTDRTVLELGSGAGLTGLAICKMCHPRAYIFSDCHSRVLKQLRGNVLLNGLSLEADITANLDSPRVTVAQLDWDVTTVCQLSAFQPDVVIAADVLYCPEAIMSLVGVLRRLAACREHQRAPEVYVAFTVRNPGTCQLFTTELGRAGIKWEAEPRHDQKLFPYEEHLEMAILNLTL